VASCGASSMSTSPARSRGHQPGASRPADGPRQFADRRQQTTAVRALGPAHWIRDLALRLACAPSTRVRRRWTACAPPRETLRGPGGGCAIADPATGALTRARAETGARLPPGRSPMHPSPRSAGDDQRSEERGRGDEGADRGGNRHARAGAPADQAVALTMRARCSCGSAHRCVAVVEP
jgi:hypothetical protein